MAAGAGAVAATERGVPQQGAALHSMRVVVDALLRDAGFEGSVNALFVPLCLPKAGRPARQAELPV